MKRTNIKWAMRIEQTHRILQSNAERERVVDKNGAFSWHHETAANVDSSTLRFSVWYIDCLHPAHIHIYSRAHSHTKKNKTNTYWDKLNVTEMTFFQFFSHSFRGQKSIKKHWMYDRSCVRMLNVWVWVYTQWNQFLAKVL